MQFKNQPLAAGCSILAGGLMLMTGCIAPNKSTAQRQQLLLTLEREMNSNAGWTRVHAAEALLDHGCAQVVARSFAPEVDTAPPPYRIGVWRVMARAGGTEEARQAFIGQIRRTMLNPDAPDRLHATESLAKLGAGKPSDCPVLTEWLATVDEAASAFPLWLVVLCGNATERAGSEGRLVKLLESKNSTARQRAAFALGRIKDISPTSLAQLTRRLESETAVSPARVYFLAALLRHAAKNSPEAARLRRQLSSGLGQGKPNELLERAITLGMCGKAEDLPALVRLLHSTEADARIGGASGSLYLLP